MSFICLWRSFYISKGTPSACLTNVRLCGYCFLLVQAVAPPATPYWWLEAVREDWLKRSDSKSRSATSFFGCNVHHLLLSCATSVAVTINHPCCFFIFVWNALWSAVRRCERLVRLCCRVDATLWHWCSTAADGHHHPWNCQWSQHDWPSIFRHRAAWQNLPELGNTWEHIQMKSRKHEKEKWEMVTSRALLPHTLYRAVNPHSLCGPSSKCRDPGPMLGSMALGPKMAAMASWDCRKSTLESLQRSVDRWSQLHA